MKTSLTTLLLVSLASVGALASTEQNLHETRAARPGGTIVVDVVKVIWRIAYLSLS